MAARFGVSAFALSYNIAFQSFRTRGRNRAPRKARRYHRFESVAVDLVLAAQ